ncbi:MAG: hypothetical protein AB1716_06230 [Planctomycetota bacterium]
MGPAPWYWHTFPAFEGEGRRLAWHFTGPEGDHAYLVVLRDESAPEQVRFVANIYTRVFRVSPGLLGLWYPDNPLLRVRVFDPAEFGPIDLTAVPARPERDKLAYFCRAEPLGEFLIDTMLDAGEHPLSLPVAFAGLDHLMLVGEYAKVREAACASVYEIVPGAAAGTRRLNVLPQSWFNQDDFDLGYQWITRVVRDPQTGRIYGDGIRMGTFELADDGRHLARWLTKA